MNEASNFGPSITNSGSLCQNNLVLFTEFDSIPNSIQWYKDNIALIGETSTNFNVNDSKEASYQVRLTYNTGCITLTYNAFNEDYILKMPNVFSPNKDGVNDIFKPIKFECIAEATLKIYNRWGQLVHQTSEFPLSWDGNTKGKNCSAGVYFWILEINGKEGNKKESGSVSLFR